jgi:hypothetical protein
MSDSGVGTAIPSNVNLAKQKPMAVRSFSRRVKSLATNAQSFTENQYIKIVIDSSVPGAFNDPKQSYLKFDIAFTNTNPYIDYLSFGSAGINSVIDEFRIYQQGTPLEEIINYGPTFEAFQDLSGHCKEPYYMFRESKVKQAMDPKFFVNAIKSPMVSRSGNAMYMSSVFANNKNMSSVWTSGASSSLTSAYKPFLLGTAASGVSFHRYLVSTTATQLETGAMYNINNPTQQQTMNSPATLGRTSLNQQPLTSGVVPNLNYILANATAANIVNAPIPMAISGAFHRPVPMDLPALLQGRRGTTGLGSGIFYGAPSGPKLTPQSSASSTYAPEDTNCLDSSYFPISKTVDNTDGQQVTLYGQSPSSTLFGSSVYWLTSSDYAAENPLNWPFCMPNDINEKLSTPSSSLQDYFMYLSNVKLLPIGVPGSARASANDKSNYVPSTVASTTTNLNFQNVNSVTAGGTNGTKELKTTVCVPLLSGILGVMAEKCFPTMFCAPGSMYIEIKTASASKALQVSMDPCRRVLGTLRDYIPFGGSIGGIYGQFNYLNPYNSGSTTGLDQWTSASSATTLLSASLSSQVYFGVTTPGSSVVTNSVAAIAQTPWTSNSYFGIGSGGVFMPLQTDPSTVHPSAYYNANNVDLYVSSRPSIGGCFACIGANMASLQRYMAVGGAGSPSNLGSIVGNGVGVTLSVDLVYSPFSAAAMEGKWVTYETISESCQMQGVTSYTFPRISSTTLTADSTGSTYYNNIVTSIPAMIPYNAPISTSITQDNTPAALNPSGLVAVSTAGGGAQYIYTSSLTSTAYNTSGSSFIFPQALSGCINMNTKGDSEGDMTNAMGTSSINSQLLLASHLPVPSFGCAQQNSFTYDDAYALQYVGDIPALTMTHLNDSLNTGDIPDQTNTVTGANLRGARYSTWKSASNRPVTQSAIVTMSGTSIPQFSDVGFGAASDEAVTQSIFTPMNCQEMTVCGHAAGVPLPQYILVLSPWNKKSLFINMAAASGLGLGIQCFGDIINQTDLATETTACYGTYLDESRAQSLRCFNQYGGSTNYVKYTISNVEFVSQQIILPEAVTSSLIEMAARQDISISTNMIRVYQSTINSSTTQNIIIPAKVASANSLYILFQPQNYLNTTEGQLYNSMSRMCPFSRISSADVYPQTSATSSTSVTSQAQYVANSSQTYAVGQRTPFNIENCPSVSGSFSVQLILGNEYIPQQPMTAVSEIVAELMKCQHKLMDTGSNFDGAFSLTPSSGYTSNSTATFGTVSSYADSTAASQFYYDCLQPGGFCTAFTFAGYLDDQTYIQNPNWNYVAACAWNTNASTYVATTYTLPGGTQSSGYGGVNAMWGARGPYSLPCFTPLESKFIIGFDLDTWSRQSDVVRSGRYLGANTIQLKIDNATALNYGDSTYKSGLVGVNMLSIVQFDAHLSFQSGGSVICYY